MSKLRYLKWFDTKVHLHKQNLLTYIIGHNKKQTNKYILTEH